MVRVGYSLVAVLQLRIAVASFAVEALGTQASVAAAWGLSSCDSRALEHRLSSCGIFPDLGLNLCLQHWQANFLTTEPPGKPSPGLVS